MCSPLSAALPKVGNAKYRIQGPQESKAAVDLQNTFVLLLLFLYLFYPQHFSFCALFSTRPDRASTGDTFGPRHPEKGVTESHNPFNDSADLESDSLNAILTDCRSAVEIRSIRIAILHDASSTDSVRQACTATASKADGSPPWYNSCLRRNYSRLYTSELDTSGALPGQVHRS